MEPGILEQEQAGTQDMELDILEQEQQDIQVQHQAIQNHLETAIQHH